MVASIEKSYKKHQTESDDRKTAKDFLLTLPKLESHYCCSSTSKLYLEPIWPSLISVYKEYLKFCEKINKNALSRKSFSDEFNKMNLSLFQPKKDQCDICSMHKLGNYSDLDFNIHQRKKEEARMEKVKDKEEASNDCSKLLFAMDLQAVLLSPNLKASALYYKTKLSTTSRYTI